MCLSRQVENNKAPITVGYQLKEKVCSGTYQSPLFGNGEFQRQGEWLDSNNYSTTIGLKFGGEVRYYISGFHVFHRLIDARFWKASCEVICKVACKNEVARGEQVISQCNFAIEYKPDYYAPISVFRYIKILREVN